MAEFPVTKPEFIVPSCVNLSTYIQGMSDYEVRCYYTQLVQQWATEWAQMQTEWSNQQEAFESFKQYVNNKLQTFQDWFDNLDVQQEINTKIDEMISDGTFLTIIQSTVNSQAQSATDAWLQENMTPGAGAPALDSSLTLENAAAQSATVGQLWKNGVLNSLRYTNYFIYKQDNTTFGASGKLTPNKFAITADEYNKAPTGSGTNNAIIYGIANGFSYNTGETIILTVANPNDEIVVTLSTSTNWNSANSISRRVKANSVSELNFSSQSVGSVTFNYIIVRYLNKTALSNFKNVVISESNLLSVISQFDNVQDLINYNNEFPTKNIIEQTLASNLGFTSAVVYNNSSAYSNVYAFSETKYQIDATEYNEYGSKGTGNNNGIIYTLQDPIQCDNGETVTLYIVNPNPYSILVFLTTQYNWAPANSLRVSIKGNGFYKANFTNTKESTSFPYFGVRRADGLDLSNLVPIYATKNPQLYTISNPEKIDADYKIIFWGDSLTAGAGGSGTTYPSVCANKLGVTSYLNAGVGGESAYTIAARQGADFFTVTGNVNGTYNLNEFAGLFGGNINPLRQGTGGDTVNPITINGQKCNLTITQSSATDPNATYTISNYSGGLAFAAPVGFSGSKLVGDINVFFVGQNGPSDYNARISIIKKMIAKTNGKCVILGLSSGTSESRAVEEQAYLQEFGAKYFNTRDNLVKYGLAINNIDPTEQDNADIEQGTIPDSLRSDAVHLNAAGYMALGTMLAAHISTLYNLSFA